MFESTFEDDFTQLLDSTPLYTFEKTVIKTRYFKLVENARRDYVWSRNAYFVMSNCITVFGVLIAALVPVSQSQNVSRSAANGIYWAVFAMALCLAILNKVLSTHNIDTNRIVGAAIIAKYESEGYSFIAGVGRYASVDWHERFTIFCARLEKIKIHSSKNTVTDAHQQANDILAAAPADVDKSQESPKLPVKDADKGKARDDNITPEVTYNSDGDCVIKL